MDIDQPLSFSDDDKHYLFALARESVSRRQIIPINLEEINPVLCEQRGLFVTLTKQSQLRGCIGSMLPTEPIAELVSRMAIQASFHDPRFMPLGFDELSQVLFEITILEPYRRLSDPDKVIVGKHGLMIRSGGRQGVLLPQVAIEWEFDRIRFLEAVCEKAGLSKDAWNGDADMWTFTAVHFKEDGKE
jgi:AmmeMemoRadiSam system protein A